MLGPLAIRAEPHGYDLCGAHAESLSAPAGLGGHPLGQRRRTPSRRRDDLLALADAVREVGFSYDQPAPAAAGTEAAGRPSIVEIGRRAHLTVLADPDA